METVLAGGGEMGQLMRSIDWSKTPLGPVSGWSQALRTMVGLLLRNRFPLLVWWGPSFIQLYNDAYRPIAGEKHPRSMGQPARECWAEIWHIIGPMIEAPFSGQAATWSDDLVLLLDRKGFLEETHFKVAYSPVPDETVPNSIGGVLATVAETTNDVYGERQLRTLGELSAKAAEADTPSQACMIAAATFEENPSDIPFALLYLLDAEGHRAHLASSCSFGTENGLANPSSIDLQADPNLSAWPLGRVVKSGQAEVVVDLGNRFRGLPSGRWFEPPHAALILPLKAPEQPRPFGVLVAGISPHRELDQGYRTFFELAAAQIVTAIRNAMAYQEERRRAEALAEIDRAKTAFFSNVSHEFRTPLTLMLAPQEDALGSVEGVLGGEDLRAVHRNTLRLLKLVNTLLDFSRTEAGRARASYQPVDLAALTKDLASAFRSAIERGGLEFGVQCPPLDAPVYVDRDMWEKIVLNLLSNAFKFTLEGAITISLREVGDHVELEVRDTGVGIAEGDLPRVFERFHRIEGARTRSQEGSGIGLALVHDLVQLHRGRIDVASRLGSGTTFKVSLPLGNAHLPAQDIGAAKEALAGTAVGAEPFVAEALRWLPTAAADRSGPGPLSAAPGLAATDTERAPRVLIADDNADMRDYLTRLLQQHWRVEAVADGAQALARARERPPDLILTDVMMPQLDGFGLLRTLRDDTRTASIPVIMLSARAGEEARVEGLRAGVDDYLVKPFSGKELLTRVATRLELGRLRRRAELEREKLQRFLMAAPFAILWLEGPEHRVVLSNPKHRELIGGKNITGKTLLEGLPELAGQPTLETLDRVYETGESFSNRRMPISLERDGRVAQCWFDLIFEAVRDESGRVEGVLSCSIDVTADVLAGQEIDSARQSAESANRAKDEFLAMLGHELRNPLSPILTAVQLLRMQGHAARELDVIDRQVGHLVRLVDDLLDISRITGGKVELRKERLELSTVVVRAMEMAAPLIDRRRQQVELIVAPEGLPIDGDPYRLAQVVSNLLTNASKYSEPGTRIRVEASRDGGLARLSVIDQGSGIAPEMLTRIFDLFVQQPQSIDRSKGGLGLGLAIVRSLVMLHGGRVSATSAGLTQGSEFVVELPLAREADASRPAYPARPPALTNAGHRPEPSRNRILVVDANTDAAEIVAEILRALGYKTETAHDGPSALKIAKRFRPNVCLVDIGLPVMDGYDLARQLRSSNDLATDARIIAITGYGQEMDRRRSTEAGFNAHLVKPVSLDVLSRAVVN